MKKPKISKIKLMRVHTGFSQADIAEMLDVNQASVSYWEIFRYIPTIAHMKKIVDIAKQYGYDLNLEELQEDYIQ